MIKLFVLGFTVVALTLMILNNTAATIAITNFKLNYVTSKKLIIISIKSSFGLE